MAKKAMPKEEKFEALLARLEEIVRRLESGDLELEESLAAFEEGVALSRSLNQRLEAAQSKVELLLKDGSGNLIPTPFDQSADEPDGN